MGNLCCIKTEDTESYQPLQSIPMNQKISVKVIAVEDGSCLKIDYNGIVLDCVLHQCKWLSEHFQKEYKQLIREKMKLNHSYFPPRDFYVNTYKLFLHLLSGIRYSDIEFYNTNRIVNMIEPFIIEIVNITQNNGRYEIIMYQTHDSETINKRLNSYFS
jgi:hypothetical protein